MVWIRTLLKRCKMPLMNSLYVKTVATWGKENDGYHLQLHKHKGCGAQWISFYNYPRKLS